jgi:hypothetical protein
MLVELAQVFAKDVNADEQGSANHAYCYHPGSPAGNRVTMEHMREHCATRFFCSQQSHLLIASKGQTFSSSKPASGVF